MHRHAAATPRPSARTRTARRAGLAAAAAAVLASTAAPALAASGDLDPTFSGDGRDTGAVGSSRATATALQPDGALIVAGTATLDDGSVTKNGIRVARWTTSGTRDTAYGGGGVTLDVNPGPEFVRDVTIDGKGRAVVLGTTSTSDPTDTSDIWVARLTAAGTLDTTFGTRGIVRIDRTAHDVAGGVLVKGTRVYVSGSLDAGGNWSCQWTVFALTDTGAADTAFSGDGQAEVPSTVIASADSLRDLAMQKDGKLLLGGTAVYDFAVVRLNTDGSVDKSWSGDGVATTRVANGGLAYSLLVQGDGKVVLAGTAYAAGRSDQDAAAVRFTTSGSLDTSFSGDGMVTLDPGGAVENTGLAASLAADGKIVLVGTAYNGSGSDLGVLRMNWNGTPDTSFSTDGFTSLSTSPTGNEAAEAAVVAPSGRTVVVGENNDGWQLAAYRGGADRTLTIGDVTVAEPNSGTTTATLTIRLAGAAATGPVTVGWSTGSGTALSGSDFTTASGRATIPAGATSAVVKVAVIGDTAREGTEQFTVRLANPTDAGIADGSATVAIADND